MNIATAEEKQSILLLANVPYRSHLRSMLQSSNPKVKVFVGEHTATVPPEHDIDMLVVRAANVPDANIDAIRITYPHHPTLLIVDEFPQHVTPDEPHMHIIPAEAVNERSLQQHVDKAIQQYEQATTQWAQNRILAITNEYDAPKDLLEQLFNLLQDVVPYTAANIRMLDNDKLRLYHWRNYDPEALNIIEDEQLSARFPILDHIYAEGVPLYLPDTHAHPDWVTNDKLSWVRSWMGFPISKQGRVIGTLTISKDVVNGFRAVHVNRVRALLEIITLLVTTAQLREADERTNRILKAIRQQNEFLFTPLARHNTLQELCNTIAKTVVQAFGKTDCGVMLLNEADTELIRVARAGDYQVDATEPLYMDGKGLAIQAVQTGDVVYAPNVNRVENYIANEPRTRSELVIPLKTRTGVIGVLDLQSPQLDAFTHREWDGLIGFAEHAATAIQNLRWFASMRSQNQLLEKRVEERTGELDSARRRVEAILNRTSDALALLNTEGKISQTNRAFETMFDIQPDEYFGRSIAELVQGESQLKIEAAISEAHQSDKQPSVEVDLYRSDGTHFFAEIKLSLVRLHDLSNEKPDIVCSIRDITKHKEIESNLRQALETTRELSDLKSRFIRTVAHEFRTPLTVIASSSELLRDYSSQLDEARRAKHFEQILKQVEHMEAMLEDTLAVSQGQENTITFQPGSFSIKNMVENTVSTVNQMQDKPVIRTAFKGDDFTIYADHTLIQQVVTNLLTNAVKYSPDSEYVNCTLKLDHDRMTLVVQDEGIGIPEEEQRMLFQPFFRAKNVNTFKGTGLGLSIVKYAVERHNGSIYVDSAENTGTTITIVLPRETTT